MEPLDLAWCRQEGLWIFCVDTTFNRMAANMNFILFDRQRLTGSNFQLFFDQVHTGDHFCYRMFYLNTGVHFNEIELTVFVQEFKGTGTTIIDLNTSTNTTFADIAAHIFRDAWCWRFFDYFLVTTLHRAITFTQIDRITLTIG